MAFPLHRSPPTEIRVGPAGWSYTDWSGYVYPSRRPKGFHEATYLAQFFDTIEINTSFYSPMRDDERAVREGFDVLRGAGKLGAVLAQFPFSFHRTAETMVSLTVLLQRFADYPLAVELRHASWIDPAVYALLREHNAAFCNIDQPIIGRSIEPRDASLAAFDRSSLLPGAAAAAKPVAMAPLGYIRLHGRRYDTWFNDDPTIPGFERYNYLYSTEELRPWADRVRTEGEHTQKVFAVTNNHYLGKGVVNALQLLSMLKGAKVNVPDPLRIKYPELEKIAAQPPERPTLFPLDK
jgi:uncharacterized protein YecE (DUF72 family)